MESFLLIVLLVVVGIGAVLFVTARKAMREGEREAVAKVTSMVEKAESTRAWMMTKEAHDEFKAAVRLATAVELREMFLVSMQAELEAEGRQKRSADDDEMLAMALSDLDQIRMRLGWIREEYATRGISP